MYVRACMCMYVCMYVYIYGDTGKTRPSEMAFPSLVLGPSGALLRPVSLSCLSLCPSHVQSAPLATATTPMLPSQKGTRSHQGI